MEKISEIRFGPLPSDSPYVKPFRMYYVQNGKEKNWDLMKVHDSVSIVLFNTSRDKLVFVKQFRPACYHSDITRDSPNFDPENLDLEKYPPNTAVTIELCAGIVDKNKSLVEIAQEEILEECGYYVPADRIQQIKQYRAGVGTNGAVQTMYYCEVTDNDKQTVGGGVGDEIIEIYEMNLDEARKLFSGETFVNAPASCIMGITWFFANRAPK